MNFSVKKKINLILFLANLLLLSLAWIMAFYSYPRLPHRMPLWINFFKQQTILMEKSPLFFLYPLVQSVFCLCFWLFSRIDKIPEFMSTREEMSFPEMKKSFSKLRKEFIYLALIFFNLIYIHLQKSLILLAHKIAEGVDKLYFSTLFVIILLLIPLYRLRIKLLISKKAD